MPTSHSIRFKNGAIELAGVLHLPAGFDDHATYCAIVIVTPGSSVKEQVGAVWGKKLAARGFIALTYDASFQGESGGLPRDLEDPAMRVEDARCAVDYLMTLAYVDEDRVGVLGDRVGAWCGAGYRRSGASYNAVCLR